ncbi:MAG TPA: acetylornithine/succinylornithine family transaminase [Longimicrobiales bacterium]|nr:acetylornithine/succinylornithine family transaminase [Longimicrobiales bacterium]
MSLLTAVEQNTVAALLKVYRPMESMIVGGRGSYLLTEDGRELLDFTSGIGVNAFGYGDPQLQAAIIGALGTGLIHVSNLFRTPPAQALAARLVELSFADRVFFCNSGGEANEGALKFARRFARARGGAAKHEIVALKGSFHGRLFGTLAVTDRPAFRAPFEPVMPGVHFVDVDDLSALAAAVSAERTAAIIVEPVQGEGGVRPLSNAYLAAVREAANATDAVLIFDEVQCGLGRTGALFAYQRAGVEPDIMTLAKPLAGGLPMGAILLNDRIAAAVQPGDHATTFGGGPLVSTVALSVVNRLAAPEFLADVASKGEYLADLLGRVLAHPNVTQVRGIGLMWGIELDGPAAQTQARCAERGLLVTLAGEKVIRLLPPLTITRSELEAGIELLQAALP